MMLCHEWQDSKCENGVVDMRLWRFWCCPLIGQAGLGNHRLVLYVGQRRSHTAVIASVNNMCSTKTAEKYFFNRWMFLTGFHYWLLNKNRMSESW